MKSSAFASTSFAIILSIYSFKSFSQIELSNFKAVSLCDSVHVFLGKARPILISKAFENDELELVIRKKANCHAENIIGAFQHEEGKLNLLHTLKGAIFDNPNIQYQKGVNPHNNGILEQALCDCYTEMTFRFSQVQEEPVIQLFSKPIYSPDQIYNTHAPTFEVYKSDTVNYTDSIGNKQGRWITINNRNQIIQEEYYFNSHSDSVKVISYHSNGAKHLETRIGKKAYLELTYSESGILEKQCHKKEEQVKLYSQKYLPYQAHQFMTIEICITFDQNGDEIETTIRQVDL